MPPLRITLVSVVAAAVVLAGCAATPEGTAVATSSPQPARSAAPTPEQAQSTPTPTPTPAPTPTRLPGTYMIGETSEEFAGGMLTLDSVELVSEVATTDGEPITAAEGEQLVVFRTHFVNTGPETVDLTCAGVPNWYITVWDTEQRELAPVFEGYRIPGNPECNHQLLSGQEAGWTFVFRGIAGSTPRVLQIEDSRTFEDWIAFALTDEPLQLAD